jgi:hypothetical protein
MEQGLPRLDFFQFDVLDGALIGSIDIRPVEEYFFSTFVVQFSGLNIEKLPALPGSAKMKKTPEQSEVSGRMVISLPLQPRVQALLRSGEVQIDLYDIGSRTLDRLLYALDPYESNETIVQQRKLVRNGYPLWVKIRIKNGMFFLEGKVSVRGIEMDIPTLERFNLTGLPGMEKYEKYLESVELVTKALNILHANAIVANDKGEIIFNRENIHDTN